MQTICPHCQTVFKVSDEHLKVADGYVRCGICKEVFNALETDQLEDPKKPITESEITDAAEKPFENNIQHNDTGSIEKEPEKNIEPTVAKDQSTSLANEYLSDGITETPRPETLSSDNTDQADMFTAPSATNKIESEPAPVTTVEAKTTKSEPIEIDTPKTDSPVTETKVKTGTENKPGHQKEKTHHTATDATSNIAKQPSTVAKSTTPIKNVAITKNTIDNSSDLIDDNLFDGFQSKLIPDEYRIPELHNTYSIWHDIAWSLAILTLTASLFAEYTWFNRNELISNPQLRPLVTQFCVLINCDAMALREPGEIEMTTRNIYTHPNVKNGLMISGTLVNHADFEQPYPKILIDFSDVRGEVIASRVFTPEDYLQIKTTRLRPLPPRTPTNFNMEILDPGKNAMTYEFSFL